MNKWIDPTITAIIPRKMKAADIAPIPKKIISFFRKPSFTILVEKTPVQNIIVNGFEAVKIRLATKALETKTISS
jgi:hypothetical protein